MFGYSQSKINHIGDEIVNEYVRKLYDCKTEAEVEILYGYTKKILRNLPKYSYNESYFEHKRNSQKSHIKIMGNQSIINTQPNNLQGYCNPPDIVTGLSQSWAAVGNYCPEPSISERLTKLEKDVKILNSGGNSYQNRF